MSASTAGRIGVFGASGSGKSAYVKKLVKDRQRVIVFDPLSEYHEEGFDQVSSVDQARQRMAERYAQFRLALVPTAARESAFLNQLSQLVLMAQQPFKDGASKLQLTLVIEEMALSFPNPAGPDRAPQFAKVCSMGRHFGIEVIGVSQRIAEVATRFRGNCTETVILRQQGPNDLSAAVAASGIPKEEISALENLSFIHSAAGLYKPGKLKF